jgi:ketosteroid isomerase-like protein
LLLEKIRQYVIHSFASFIFGRRRPSGHHQFKPPSSMHRALQPRELDGTRRKNDVASVIFAFFEAGKNKDLGALYKFHAPRGFSKFDENPPYTRQNSDEAFVHEQAAFANISDYDYKVEDLKIDFLDNVAVATFYLAYKGIFVNDYSFEGKSVSSKSRVTMVLSSFPDGWKIVHQHSSPLPDFKERPDTTKKRD